MTPDEFMTEALRTSSDHTKARLQEYDPDQDRHLNPKDTCDLTELNHAVLGLSGEVGELASLLTKYVYHGKKLTFYELRAKIADELGDVLWYCALCANGVAISLEEVMVGVLAKLKARYPDKFDPEKCENKNREAESEAQKKLIGEAFEPTVTLPPPPANLSEKEGQFKNCIVDNHGFGYDADQGMCEFGHHEAVYDADLGWHCRHCKKTMSANLLCKHEWQLDGPSTHDCAGSSLSFQQGKTCKLCGKKEQA